MTPVVPASPLFWLAAADVDLVAPSSSTELSESIARIMHRGARVPSPPPLGTLFDVRGFLFVLFRFPVVSLFLFSAFLIAVGETEVSCSEGLSVNKWMVHVALNGFCHRIVSALVLFTWKF